MKSGAAKTIDKTAALLAAVEALTTRRVMVGVPEDKSSRQSGSISNAALAYIHDRGCPEAGIPARPFMEPGVRRAADRTAELMKRAGELALELRPGAVEAQLHKVGLVNQASIRGVIAEGIPPPIKYATALARIRRRQSKSWRQKRREELRANADYLGDEAASAGIFTPLIDTAQLLKSITSVLRRVAGGARRTAA